MFCLTRPPPHSNPLPTSSNKEEVKKGPFKLLLENFKEAGSGKENPPTWGSPRFRKQLNTRWQFLWRSATWEVGKRSPDVLRTDLDINNL